MIRFAADEDFNNDIVRALRRSLPGLNIVGVREAGRGGQPEFVNARETAVTINL
jgi:hypothetical protein